MRHNRTSESSELLFVSFEIFRQNSISSDVKDSSFLLIIKILLHSVTLLGKSSLTIETNISRLILSSLNLGRSVYWCHTRHMSAMIFTSPHLVDTFLGNSFVSGGVGVGH
jgi:hypothetical protein